MRPVPRRFESIQCLRALAALAVVVFHDHLSEAKLGGAALIPASAWYCQAGVDLFFVISGFIITTITRGKFGKPGESRRFLWSRLTRIYPIYWVYFLAVTAVYLAAPHLVNAQHGAPNLLASALLLPQTATPILFVSWTLVFELYFYLVFVALLTWLPERLLPRALLVWGGLVVVAWAVLGTHSPALRGYPAAQTLVSPLILEFLLGCLVALYAAELPRRAAIVCTALGVGGFVAGTMVMIHLRLDFSTGRVLLFGPAAALLVAGLVGWEKHGLGFPRLLVWFGDGSYSLYLSHILVLGVLFDLWTRFMPTAPAWSHVTILAAAAVAAVIWGQISFAWIEAPMLRALKPRRTARPVTGVYVPPSRAGRGMDRAGRMD